MEQWFIAGKLTILLYIMMSSVLNPHRIALLIFFSLLYICINMSIYIVKKEKIKAGIILLSIIFILFSYWQAESVFLFLLPMSIYELSTYYVERKFPAYILAFSAIILLKEQEMFVYGMVATFSFIVFIMSEKYAQKIKNLEVQLDNTRKSMHTLNKTLYENNVFMKQSEYTIKLEERNRLSQEIHDKIGHSLTGALIQMEASKRLMEIDKEKAMELLQNAIDISSEGIEDIRITLKSMKPPQEQLGVNRIKLLVDEYMAKNNIQVHFVYKGNIDIISPIQWKIILENVTEALTNAAKYSQATKITIDIHMLNKFVKVEVKDNGQGARLIKKGLGIIGMEERAASVNGKIIIDASDGFSVTMLLPI